MITSKEISETYAAVLETRTSLGLAARVAGLRWKPAYSEALAACETAVLHEGPDAVDAKTEKFIEVATLCGVKWSSSVQDALDAYLYAVHKNAGRGVYGEMEEDGVVS